MANRTFKVYGQAYAASGDVSVTMSINGTQVFSGAVNDSSTPLDGEPTSNNHLWTYELDENTVGNLAVSIAVSGGVLALGATQNNLNNTKIIPDEWWDAQDPADRDSAEYQTYIANTIGQTLLDAEQPGLYDKLIAGTATLETDGNDIWTANLKGPGSTEEFETINDIRNTLAINGATDDIRLSGADTPLAQASWWPIIEDGETLTYDWEFLPYLDAFIPA